jgi:hypothetical protein
MIPTIRNPCSILYTNSRKIPKYNFLSYSFITSPLRGQTDRRVAAGLAPAAAQSADLPGQSADLLVGRAALLVAAPAKVAAPAYPFGGFG